MKPKNTVVLVYNFVSNMTDVYINDEFLESRVIGEFNEEDIEVYMDAAAYSDMLDEIDKSNK